MAVYVDEKILSDIAAGSASAFKELYVLTSDTVYGFALSILKNSHDAEDIMQEVFVKIYNSADTYQKQGKNCTFHKICPFKFISVRYSMVHLHGKVNRRETFS